MAERFERHRQPWTSDEIQKLHLLAKKGMPLKQMAKAMTRSEESHQGPRKGRRPDDRKAAVAPQTSVKLSPALASSRARSRGGHEPARA